MKKIIKLTENDLMKLVKKVINEQQRSAANIPPRYETVSSINNRFSEPVLNEGPPIRLVGTGNQFFCSFGNMDRNSTINNNFIKLGIVSDSNIVKNLMSSPGYAQTTTDDGFCTVGNFKGAQFNPNTQMRPLGIVYVMKDTGTSFPV